MRSALDQADVAMAHARDGVMSLRELAQRLRDVEKEMWEFRLTDKGMLTKTQNDFQFWPRSSPCDPYSRPSAATRLRRPDDRYRVDAEYRLDKGE